MTDRFYPDPAERLELTEKDLAVARPAPMSASESTPIVTEVLRFEELPLGSRGTRRVVVRSSDGSEGDALTWSAAEILICEGDHGNCRLMSHAG